MSYKNFFVQVCTTYHMRHTGRFFTVHLKFEFNWAYSPWGCQESDTIEQVTHTHTHTHTHTYGLPMESKKMVQIHVFTKQK